MNHEYIHEFATFILTGGGWWLFSTAVRTMPQPKDGERWYGWAFSFLQAFAANHDLRKPNA